ncbi:MAG: hypothetical protein EOP40_20590 [Rubrivivax sp.]|nr:MAG: hypothetical protein EOP40_20590 [Rubrivivax sp.]
MPQFNFDLEDGEPPVSFALIGHEATRFQAFMAECQHLKTAPRGTDAQIIKEREITASAIQGAMSFGYQGSEYPPEGDAWLRPFYELGQAGRAKDLQIAAGVPAGWHLKRHVDPQVDAITVTHSALGEVTAALHSDTPQSRMLFWLCDDVLKDRKALGAEPHRLAHTDHINTTPNPADPQDLRDYKALCDLWQEANAVDTAIGRPEVLLEKIRRLRDDFGSRRQSAPKALGVELPYGDGVACRHRSRWPRRRRRGPALRRTARRHRPVRSSASSSSSGGGGGLLPGSHCRAR